MAWREIQAPTRHRDARGSYLEDRLGPVDLGVDYSFKETFYTRWGKPIFDRIVGALLLVLLSPLLLVIGVAIWVTMDSPILLQQERVGRKGRVFRLFKFRTMAPDRRTIGLEWIGQERRRTHKSADDPRITGLGRRLRSTRLDELPQFINVVLGDLSLVGPRPELLHIVGEYEPWQHRRHAIKPGVTGLWQVSDNGLNLLRDCTEMELAYLDQVTFKKDFELLLRTLPAMFRKLGF